MNTLAATINAFLEDTCVIVVLAVLLARGRVLRLIGDQARRPADAIWLGILFGAAGLTETLFPGARYPYVTHTMVVTFSGLAAGLPVSLVAAGVVSAAAFLLQPASLALVTCVSVVAAAFMGSLARRVLPERSALLGGLFAGTLAQVITLLLETAVSAQQTPLQPRLSMAQLAVSLPANGVGVLLLALVVRDAQVRAASERHRIDAEHARILAAEAQLSRLRARMHPHFLFNTLSSVAGLCGIAPDKAEAAIVRLGNLIRRVLESDAAQTVDLQTEIDYARDYLAIEQDRLGERLSVVWRLDPAASGAHVPPFSLQALLENAIGHGIAPKVGPGRLEIDVRRSGNGVLIAVRDNGEGIDAEGLRRARTPSSGRLHALQILDQQLRILYGAHARTRIFSRAYEGTLAAFVVPLPESRTPATEQNRRRLVAGGAK